MATEKFVVTAEIRTDSRNSIKLLRSLRVFALTGLVVALLSALFLLVKTPDKGTGVDRVQSSVETFTANPTAVAEVREAYGQLPLSFEANRGQADDSVDFVARGAGYTLALTPAQAAFRLRKADCGSRNENVADSENPQSEIRSPKSARPHSEIPRTPQSAVCNPQSVLLRLNLVGGNQAATVEGQNELEGRVNYLIGKDPAKWQRDVPTFGRVRYAEVYPGIDVVYYGNQKRLEYDFVVAPGRDARAIALKFAGAEKVEVDGATGDLLLRVGEETIRQHAPVTYQETAGGGRREVESRYALRDGGRVGFEVGEYDRSAPLVIDPVLVYSTYLGGSGADSARDIALDSSGNAYMCGETTSTNFPTVNAFDSTFNTGNDPADADAFVTKLNAAGTALVYSTYLGGTGTNVNLSGDDVCTGIAVDSAGNAYLAGETRSTDFPMANAFDATFGGAFEGYLTKLNAAGNALVYSTYIGGDAFDSASSVAVDSSGNTYVAGRTTSSNFPTANPIQATFAGGGSDAFVMKFNAAGSALFYSTYLGGGGGNGFDAAFGLAIDPAGNAYITGPTISTDFPTANPIQTTFGGGTNGDGYVAKINAAGSALVYSTYLGGSGNDLPQHIIADSSGNAYVTGGTESTNFPTANAFDSTLGGTSDTFVTKVNPTGSAFVYSTYLGGAAGDGGNDIRVDSSGNAHVAGFTASTDFPTVDPTQAASGGGSNDAFVTKFNAAGSALLFSTYLGGGGADSGFALAVDSAGNIYVAGITLSTNFPTLNPVQATSGGSNDAFVTKIDPSTAPPPTPTPTPTPSPSPTPTPSPATLQFSQSNFAVSESAGFVNVSVTRSGNTSTAVAVDYTTSDNSDAISNEAQAVALCAGVNAVALSKCDFNTALGTLRFAAGETTKSFTVLLTQDSYVEGSEFAPLTLSNPTNGAVLGNQSTAMLQIIDDSTEPSTNAIDNARNFVRQHYHDFLNREPDQPGWDFWTDNITKCNDPARRPASQTVEQCIDKQRETTSGAFFVSPEFQYTGHYVYVTYKGSLGRVPTFREFMRDVQQVSRGIIVANQLSASTVEANRAQYLAEYIQRPEFAAIYGSLNNQGYVDKLFQTTGTSVSNADKQALVNGLNGGTETRATVLHKVVNGTRVISEGQVEIIAAYGKAYFDSQFNPSFVQMEYFGYLRRNEDTAGFNHWLGKLNFFGDFISAEMVRSFLLSPEYRSRFGSP